MSRRSNDEDDGDDRFFDILGDFLKQYKDQVGRAIDAWARNMEKEPVRRLWITLFTIVLVGFSVGMIGYLTLVGRISSDAFTFLIGSIIGYIFSYLRLLTTGSRG